ncbi:MAG TPA: hypothetical protein IAB02_05890 [Candidatus Pullichristensenella excrementigallinarum]|uniref:Cyclic nucleotide-binding domain-containing protein n=1 Tax=Candidatus Pullichristensenella excrementigallinarum TaxID=2840907 RepID=A0A9D1LCV8_9FIRM|nr:hypothetical protein [Candidatus Pullichristensenella excrementigallinarum]
MQRIYDSKAIAAYLEKSRYGSALEKLRAELVLHQYERGELVTSPFLEEKWFQVVAQGSLNIYFVRDDGARYSLSSGNVDYVLGDMDLFYPHTANIYTEAVEPLICLSLSIDRNKDALLANNRFLRLVCKSLSNKMAAITALDAAPCSLPERVLSYMKYKCEDGVLKGLEREAFHLHCSSRQLQRVLHRLEGEEMVEKVGKGTYRLLGESEKTENAP